MGEIDGVASNWAVKLPVWVGKTVLTQGPLADAVAQGAAAMTCRLVLALWLRLPLVPIMVIGKVPTGVDAEVETVRVELPEPVTDAGVNLAVTPAGRLPVLSATALLKPLIAPTLTV